MRLLLLAFILPQTSPEGAAPSITPCVTPQTGAIFQRVWPALAYAPATFSPAQLRVFLRALIYLDTYTLIDDLAAYFTGDGENDQRCAEDVLLDTIGGLADDQLTGFALRLALTSYTALPNEGEIDFLAEARLC